MKMIKSTVLIQNFTEEESAAIYGIGQPMELEPSQVLFQRGDVGDSMFLIEEGSSDLHFVGGDPGKVLGPGDILGELAFITGGHERTATARARTHCRLRKLDEESVEALFKHQPRLLLRLLRNTCRYLLDAERRLIGSLRRRNQELEQTLDYLRRTREEVNTQELLANTDPLTQLYNRRCFDQQLNRSIQRSRATDLSLAVLLVDLDEFKSINDSYGHPAGDEVLIRVASILQSNVRSQDLPCRFGGDEFALILLDIDEAIALQRAQKIREEIAEATLVTSLPHLRITASVGGTMMQSGESAAELFERVDQQLYRAKREGRNRVSWESPHS